MKINALEKYLLTGTFFVSIFIVPWYSFDAFNASRILTLVTFGFGIASVLIFTKIKTVNWRYFRFELLVLILFIFWMLIGVFNSKQETSELFYGVQGRYTGLLTYTMLSVFMLSAIISTSEKFASNLLGVLIATGLFSGSYGLIQGLGKDPFAWSNSDSGVTGVFGLAGNPNFHSSFSAISAVAVISKIFVKSSNLRRLTYFSILSLLVSNVYLSKSQQGFFVLVLGVFALILIWVRSKNIRVAIGISITSFLGLVLVVLDLFRKVPWEPIFFEDSVSFRGDYWRAGWRMTLNNPLFGVGVDGFRDNFRLYRDQLAVSRNLNSTVDSAHNIFIDLASGSGIPLLVIYLCLIALVIRSGIQIFRQKKQYDPIFAAIFATWIAFSAQSIISVNQVGLAIWGWVLGGTVIGYKNIVFPTKKNAKLVHPISNKSSFKYIFNDYFFAIGALVGFMIALQLFRADAEFKSRISEGNVSRIVEAVNVWPQSPIRMNIASTILRNGGFPDQALEISKNAVEKFPRNFEAWQVLSQNDKLSNAERIIVFSKMRELDPLNPNIPSK